MNTVLAGFLLAAMCLLVAADPGVQNEIMEKGKPCFQEQGTTQADIEKLKAGNIKPEDVGNNLKCTIHCMLKKPGFMDEAGKLNIDAIKSKMNDDEKKEYDGALEQCNSITSNDPCQTAFLTFSCIMEHKH